MSYFEEKCAESLRRIAEATEAISKNMDQNKPATEVDTADTSRWISVEDRLPESMQDVLLAFGENMQDDVLLTFGGNMSVGFFLDGNWWARVDNEVCTNCTELPTHWMPLPEPPKEDSQ